MESKKAKVLEMKRGFPGTANGKYLPANAGDTRDRLDPWIGKTPGRRKWHPTSALLPGKFHGQRSLAGYSPPGHKESDVTETLTT